jgi:flagellar biosynthesis/type III secretory pathway chaperone
MNKDLEFLYHSLLLAMAQEYENYQELLKAIEEEANTLKKCILTDILACNAKKETVLFSIHVATELRTSAINKITAHLDIDKPLSLSQIIAHAPNLLGKKLTEYQEKFAGLIALIDKANRKNKNLVTFSLSYINNTIYYINSLTSSYPNYNPAGQIKAENLHGRLISQAG